MGITMLTTNTQGGMTGDLPGITPRPRATEVIIMILATLCVVQLLLLIGFACDSDPQVLDHTTHKFHEADALRAWLEKHGVSCAFWGQGKYKTVKELAGELKYGEAVLEIVDGVPLRTTRVAK